MGFRCNSKTFVPVVYITSLLRYGPKKVVGPVSLLLVVVHLGLLCMVPRGWSSLTYRLMDILLTDTLTEMQDMPKTCMSHHKQDGIAGNAFLPWQE